MTTKHYYAMHTPQGNATDANGTPIGSVQMFAKKRERDEWVAENSFNPRSGKAHQTATISEHDARVTMLRQYGREMYNAHELDRFKVSSYSYREYAQYYPTALMHDDYNKVIGLRD